MIGRFGLLDDQVLPPGTFFVYRAPENTPGISGERSSDASRQQPGAAQTALRPPAFSRQFDFHGPARCRRSQPFGLEVAPVSRRWSRRLPGSSEPWPMTRRAFFGGINLVPAAARLSCRSEACLGNRWGESPAWAGRGISDPIWLQWPWPGQPWPSTTEVRRPSAEVTLRL
jgi:hypothetical protein